MGWLVDRLGRIIARAVGHADRPPVVIEWPGGLRFQNLRSVREGSRGDATNKAGRLVMRGDRDGQPVKVYEAFDPSHAEFIASVCGQQGLCDAFPPVLGVSGRFVAADWAAGLALQQRRGEAARRGAMSAMSVLQARIHAVSDSDIPACSFDYWRDFIRPRFLRVTEAVGESGLGQRVVDLVDDAWSGGPQVLLHPDLTLANVVIEGDENPVIIDNELLSIGGLPALDVFNTLRSLGRADAGEYLEMYLDRSGASRAVFENDVAQAAWLARTAGSDFVAGDLATACRRMDDYRERRNLLPVDPG